MARARRGAVGQRIAIHVQRHGDERVVTARTSNLYYLTALTQEETILVLMPGNASNVCVTFQL
jgi:hypothetical protein